MPKKAKSLLPQTDIIRGRRIHLTNLSQNDRELLSILTHHTAAIYNMCIYRYRQHWIATKEAKNAARAEGEPETAYGEILDAKLLRKMLQTDVPPPPFLTYADHRELCTRFGELAMTRAHEAMLGMSKKIAPYFKRVKAAKSQGKVLRERFPGLPRCIEKNEYATVLQNMIGDFHAAKGEHAIEWMLPKTMKAQGFSALKTPISADIPLDAIRDAKLIPARGAKEWWMVVGYRKQKQRVAPDGQPEKILGVDVGVSNLMACVNLSDNDAFLIDGRECKAVNQWYNKRRADLKTKQMNADPRPRLEVSKAAVMQARMKSKYPPEIIDTFAGLEGQSFKSVAELQAALGFGKAERKQYHLLFSYAMRRGRTPDTRLMYVTTQRRNEQLRDYMRKAARYVIDYCLAHDITKIVVGKNTGWKQAANIGKKSNQAFTAMPHNTMLLPYLKYLSEEFGLNYEEVQESHTSKCSFLDGEAIEHHEKGQYIGQRVKRGLFRTAEGWLINADCNGAANIAVRGGWQGDRMVARQSLTKPRKIRIHGELSFSQETHVARTAEQRDGVEARSVVPVRSEMCPNSDSVEASARATHLASAQKSIQQTFAKHLIYRIKPLFTQKRDASPLQTQAKSGHFDGAVQAEQLPLFEMRRNAPDKADATTYSGGGSCKGV